jgi:hypothetical protein
VTGVGAVTLEFVPPVEGAMSYQESAKMSEARQEEDPTREGKSVSILN